MEDCAYYKVSLPKANVYPACHVCSLTLWCQAMEKSFKQRLQIQIRTQIRCTIWPGRWYPWFICFRVTGHTFRCNKPVVNIGDFYSESVGDSTGIHYSCRNSPGGELGTVWQHAHAPTLRHTEIKGDRERGVCNMEGGSSDTAIPSIKPRAFNWNVPWKALRVSDEWMRWLRSPPIWVESALL